MDQKLPMSCNALFLGGYIMKKRIKLALVWACITIIAGCSSPKVSFDTDNLVPENITSVELGGGQYHGSWVESRELSQTEIEELSTWVSQLSLTHRMFEEGNSPGDLNGGTGYIFNYNEDEASFTWVDTGAEKYIYYEDEWYEITSTSGSPLDLPS